jgi:DNA-binding CsgD family transcriptional regulator
MAHRIAAVREHSSAPSPPEEMSYEPFPSRSYGPFWSTDLRGNDAVGCGWSPVCTDLRSVGNLLVHAPLAKPPDASVSGGMGGPLRVRGLAMLTRKVIVTRQFGVDAWLLLYRDIAGAHPFFRSLITSESLIPLADYLAFHDELVRRFYNGDDSSHFALGRESARWALVDGPCKAFLEQKDLRGFVGSFPRFWDTYFSETKSRSQASLNGESVEFKAFDLPQWHPYFEHFVMGYMTEVLEMFCANPIGATRLRGGGGKDYHYLLHTAPAVLQRSPEDDVAAGRRLSARGGSPHLSNREIDVLLLVAKGKTNEEIGLVLGISGKTVQHHVARTYRKIDVTGRVGAAMWLAERGLVGKN